MDGNLPYNWTEVWLVGAGIHPGPRIESKMKKEMQDNCWHRIGPELICIYCGISKKELRSRK